jgi:hypothetical protein
MFIAKIESKAHPHAAVVFGALVDLALVYVSVRLAVEKPFFYAVNVACSLVLVVFLDRVLRHLLREGDARSVEVVRAALVSTGATQADIEIYKTGKIARRDVVHGLLLSIGWFAYTVWYVLYFLAQTPIQFRTRTK